MKRAVLILIIGMSLFGCRQLKEYIYLSSTDTLYLSKVQYDSVYIKENIYLKGDTIFIDKYNYKYKLLKDTVYKSKTDTVYSEKNTTKTEYKTSKFGTFCIWFFVVFCILLVIYIIIKIRKLI